MTVLIGLFKVFLNLIYLILKILPAQNKVVMISRQSDCPGLDFVLLGRALERRHRVVMLCKTLEGKEKARASVCLRYGLHIFRQMYHLATSRVCVLDSYCPAVSLLRHKKSLTVIQMWHSNGTMKRFGYSAIGKKEGTSPRMAKAMNMHRHYDVVLCSGRAYSEHLYQGFDISPDKIKIYTLPRFDLLHDAAYEQKTRAAVYARYPCLQEKPTVIYAPTFREGGHEEFARHLRQLADAFDFERYALVVKAHPLFAADCSDDRVIVDRVFTTFDMLFVADKVISDYSCVIYEAAVRDIPLYFYAYDLEEYQSDRGLALDYDTLPGFTEQEAAALVRDLEKPYDLEYLRAFTARYVENTEDCTRKVASLVEEYMPKQEC